MKIRVITPRKDSRVPLSVVQPGLLVSGGDGTGTQTAIYLVARPNEDGYIRLVDVENGDISAVSPDRYVTVLRHTLNIYGEKPYYEEGSE